MTNKTSEETIDISELINKDDVLETGLLREGVYDAKIVNANRLKDRPNIILINFAVDYKNHIFKIPLYLVTKDFRGAKQQVFMQSIAQSMFIATGKTDLKEMIDKMVRITVNSIIDPNGKPHNEIRQISPVVYNAKSKSK